MKPHKLARLRLLYVILLILIGVSVAPLWFYGGKMLSMNQDKLETQERVLQTTTSRSLAQVISLYMDNLNQQLKEFFDSITPLAAQIPKAEYSTRLELQKELANFVNPTDRPAVLYATVLNDEERGAWAGNFNATGDEFVRKALDAAFLAARQGQRYQSDPITVLRSGANESVMVMAQPIAVKGQFRGMVGAVVTLAPITQELVETSRQWGLEAYVVDNQGHLVCSSNPDKNVARLDMVDVPVVQKFLAWRGRAHVAELSVFNLRQGREIVPMLGTYAPTQKLGWGVIVQRKVSEAYYTVTEMQRETLRWGVRMVLLSLVVGFLAAKAITRPIDLLTQTARSIAQRDFSQRAHVRSRTEIGELAQTINQMAEEIQHFIGDLQSASEQNRQLFFDSIQMIAAAVDAKDPYTKGHSGRVSAYSTILARELGLPEEEIDKIRISATLHDVGKIGIEDRVLKKPGVLTNEEFEVMKRHTVFGYEIVRQVKQLTEMLPGIRWHHEALNGKGYPDGISGDELPLMVRVIAVADTFDAITTDRPYQAGSPFPRGLEILRKLAGAKYDPIVVDALHSAYTKGHLAKYEARGATIEAIPQAASRVN